MSRLRMTIVISLVVIVVVAAVGAVVAMEPLAPRTGPLAVTPFGTGFTYQGRLDQSGEPAFGGFDFTFSLYDTEVDGLQIGEAIEFHDVAVVDGLFTVQLDFGREALNGDGRWLAIGVKPMEQDGPFTLLSPRQPLTPAPYAIYASNAWSLTGNTGTNPGSNILGTTDEQPLVLGTNGVEALRIDVEGNVGIGIANPQSALEIANASEMLRIDGTGGSYLRIRKGTDNTSNGLIETIKEGSFRSALYLNANEPNDVIIAQGGGNVGIGFHPHVGPEAPQAKLHVKPHSDNDVEVVRFESNDGELIVVDKDGNMGIGTTSPQSALQVSGYTQLDLTSGEPPSTDCDEASERGRMKVDSTLSVMYICFAAGWKALSPFSGGGIVGYERVQAEIVVDRGDFGNPAQRFTLIADCPTGTKVLGGGVETTGPDTFTLNVKVISSFPVTLPPDNHAWSTDVQVHGAGLGTVVVHAICAS